MASKRDQIKLSPEEVADFLADQRVMNVATYGPDGWPHLTSLWYVMRGVDPWIWTYAKSQKVKNLERDPRATVLVEAGVEYTELRGLMIEAEALIHREPDVVAGFGKELTVRYSDGIDSVEGEAAAALEAQAAKRVAISFPPARVRSWDHRKLGRTY